MESIFEQIKSRALEWVEHNWTVCCGLKDNDVRAVYFNDYEFHEVTKADTIDVLKTAQCFSDIECWFHAYIDGRANGEPNFGWWLEDVLD